MAEPFLERTHLAGQVSDADSTVTNQPRNEHDRQTRSKAEYHRHEPAPRGRKSQRDIDHRQEIDETMGAESDGKEDTEDEGPQPTLFAIRLFEPFADAVVVLVVMVTAEEQNYSADKHEAR